MSSHGEDLEIGASYSDASPFVRLLGTPGRAKIIDVFLRKHYKELSASEVSRLADIAPSTFHRNVNDLVESGLVLETRDVGGTQLYELNTDNPVAQIFGRLRAELLEHIDDVPEPYTEPSFDEIIEMENPELEFPSPSEERRVAEDIRAESAAQLGITGD